MAFIAIRTSSLALGSSPLAATASSHSHISALLDLHERASTRNSRLVQVCVIDHTSPLVAEGLPHLHIQFLFSGHSRSAWAYVDTDLATLNEAILSWSARSRHRISLRVHLHEEMPSNGGPADAEAVAALPRLVLQQASAERLSADGYDACPICLDKYDAGDEVVCMPCSGNHISHTPCLVKWLATASTCPSCRFVLPSKGSAPVTTELYDLCAGARATLERIRRDEAAPCPPCDPEHLCGGGEAGGGDAGLDRSKPLDECPFGSQPPRRGRQTDYRRRRRCRCPTPGHSHPRVTRAAERRGG